MDGIELTWLGDADWGTPELSIELRLVLAHLTAAIAGTGDGWAGRWTETTKYASMAGETQVDVRGVDASGRDVVVRTTSQCRPGTERLVATATAAAETAERVFLADVRLEPHRFLPRTGDLRCESEIGVELASGPWPPERPRPRLVCTTRIEATDERIAEEAVRGPSLTPKEEAELERARAEFLKPFAERRGVDWTDSNHDALLVWAPLADVAASFQKHGYVRHAAALGRSIRLGSRTVVVVRFAGQAFATVFGFSVPRPPLPPIELSRDLGARVLRLAAWEELLLYERFEDGELVEELETEEDGRILRFSSRSRTRRSLARRQPSETIDAWVAEQGGYVPLLRVSSFFGADARVSTPVSILKRAGTRLRFEPEIAELDVLTADGGSS